jgi:ABC-type multidrug transport system ATPase subunit
VHTAVWIVNKCLNGDLIHGRTVLLVSHNVPLLAPLAASVISMGAGGRVLSVGPPKDNILRDHIMTNQLAHEQTVLEEEPEGELVDQGRPIGTEDTKLVIPEDVQRGSIGWDAFKLYFSALSRYPVLYAATCIVIASSVIIFCHLGPGLTVHSDYAKALSSASTCG